MKRKLNCILLVDDDEATNYLSNIILEDENCANHIQTEQSAETALKYIFDTGHLSENPSILPFPDLIFLDINMPAVDGWEFLSIYKTLINRLPLLPTIIMLSTSLNPDDKLKALGIPEVSDFQYKPMTTGMINSILARWFSDYN